MKRLLLKSALLFIGILVSVRPANATLTYASEDIVVAFSNNATPNHTGNTYLVDLGPGSRFKAGGSLATGATVAVNTPTAASILTDLTAAEITSANRTWSLQGANDTILDLFLSKQRPSIGTASTPFINGSSAGPNTDILTVMFSFGTAAAASTTPNSFIQNTTDTASYAAFVFGTNSPTQAYEAYSNPEAPVAGLLDLYQITDGTGNATRLGYFDFNTSTGLIRFTAQVPEPSTSLLALMGVTACAFRRFRRASVLL